MRTILLYGATGYSGQLIAEELRRLRDAGPGCYRIILAGRSAERLRPMANAMGMAARVFGIDDEARMKRALDGVDVVINAAGPFGPDPDGRYSGAAKIADAVVKMRCHYVDINGDVAVYERLSRIGEPARQNDVAIVCAAGFWAAASDLMLDAALPMLRQRGRIPFGRLGAIRIGMSRIRTFSAGSARTVWQALRDDVVVVRQRLVDQPGGGRQPTMVLREIPVGRLERSFDFGARDSTDGRRIATAASLVDTLAARSTASRHDFGAARIESYVEAGLAGRTAYSVAAIFAPLIAQPTVQTVLRAPLDLLPAGPTRQERDQEPHVVVLEIEDAFYKRVIDWRWSTPNVYQFTAQLAAAVAAEVAGGKLSGWRTPAEILGPLGMPMTGDRGALRGCVLDDRSPPPFAAPALGAPPQTAAKSRRSFASRSPIQPRSAG